MDWGRLALDLGTGGMAEFTRSDPFGVSGVGGGKGGKGGEAPATPDFTAAAERQADAARDLSREQTAANRPNQSGPFGSSTWTQDGNGQWSQNTSLAPGLQGAATGYQDQMSAQAGQPLPDGSAARDQAISAAYGQATSRLDPQWSSRAGALESALANKGLTPGSEAYSASQRDFNLGRNDAYSSAMNGAIGQGTQAGNAIFQQGMQSRQLPAQMLAQLQGLSGQPGFATAGSSAAPNYLGALGQQYGGELQQYGMEQANKNSLMGGLAGLGGAAVMASDERLKTNVRRSLLEVIPGVPFATWEWKTGGESRGVIAQDLEKVRPDLVITNADGIRLVNYSGLMEAAR
jgi:hypothetical protein